MNLARAVLLLLLALSVLLAIGAGCSPPAAKRVQPEPSGAIAFVHVDVVTMTSPMRLTDQTVVIEGGRVVKLGPSSEIELRGAQVIDARGKVLIPGLADMHAHLEREEDLSLYLARGVTLVRNMWGSPITLDWRSRVEKGSLAGPHIVTAGPILDGEEAVHDGSLVVRSAEDAERAVAMHREAGYDFVKVYSRLSAPAYQRLVEASHRNGFRVAGHVPRTVGLGGVIAAKHDVVEHFEGFLDELQADGSELKGKFDRTSKAKKIDHVDESKLPGLARSFAEKGLFNCPTLDVVHSHSPDEVRRLLARDEMKYLPSLFRAIWGPGREKSAEVRDAEEREDALMSRALVELDRAGAPLLVGTDTGNPHVIPGFNVAEEIERWVRAGVSPEHALRAATVTPAELLGRRGKSGVVAVGAAADLVLLDANPLDDIAALHRVAGVVIAGRWLDHAALEALLASARASIGEHREPTAGLALRIESTPGATTVFRGRYEQSWKGAPFAVEEVVVEAADTESFVQARAFDYRSSQRTRVKLQVDPQGLVSRARIDGDGTLGRGSVDIQRTAEAARVEGTLLSSEPIDLPFTLEPRAAIGVERLLVGWVAAAPRLTGLAVGAELVLDVRTAHFGSKAELEGANVRVTRAPDEPLSIDGRSVSARLFEIASREGSMSRLWTDDRGFPLRYEIEAYGSAVRYERVD